VRFIYSFGIRLYVTGVFVASFFNQKAKLWMEGRKNWQSKNENKANQLHGCVWFHCASLGEFEMARPLIERLKKEKPETKILLTFFSPSGYEIRKNYELADLVIYIPTDTKSNASYFVDAFRPSLAVFVKYEIWLNILDELKKNKIKTILISAVFHSEQRFFKWYGKIFREALYSMDKIYVQNEASHEILKKWKIDSVIAGDTRYDRVNALSKNAMKIPAVLEWKNGQYIIIAGSSWQPEEDLLCDFANNGFANKHPNQKIIFAPHDISENHLVELENKLEIPHVRYSKFSASSSENILIIDNIGLLSSLYAYSEIAIIGGGFSGKLHNILEAATYAIPVLFGPKHQKFQEAEMFLKEGAAFEFNDVRSFIEILDKLLEYETFRMTAGLKSRKIVEKNLGATDIIWKENFS
jgi:3-deoxy-D-manno-octulosonic-acid transferase